MRIQKMYIQTDRLDTVVFSLHRIKQRNFYRLAQNQVLRLLLTQRSFVRASMRSKTPTTFYPQKAARVARPGKNSFEFCPLRARLTHENR